MPETKKQRKEEDMSERKPGNHLEKGENTAGMQRYLIVHEYVGQAFCGWQKQPKGIKTVQSVLEKALSDFIGKETIVYGSSRTDTGVHGLGNTCHVDLTRRPRDGKNGINVKSADKDVVPYEPVGLKRALNHRLRLEQVSVTKVVKVDSEFHARFHAKRRKYFYKIASGDGQLSLFEEGRSWHVHKHLDIDLMRKAAKMLTGLHDFSSFRASGCQALDPIKRIDTFEVNEQELNWPERYTSDEETRRRHIIISTTAKAFLYHQVRLMVGLLKAVGVGDVPLDQVTPILEAKDITALNCAMAPAHGLYLASVDYDFDLDNSE